jgi:hypothetical protein
MTSLTIHVVQVWISQFKFSGALRQTSVPVAADAGAVTDIFGKALQKS